jgi:hypothetical protein
VKLSKKTGNPSEGQAKVIRNNWKDKAISRRKENEKLQKRIKELTASRDGWKNKYKAVKTQGTAPDFTMGQKAARHQYGLAIIVMMVELYKYGGMSLRGCRHSLCCMFLCMGLSGRVPSHGSIRNWLCKCGAYRVQAQAGASGEYVIYIDESITFGSEKILLILGMARENITYRRSLTHEDMEVLYVGAGKEWKGEDIQGILDKVAKGKNILYAVSDEGRNLVKAYKLLKYSHIQDCTHKLANYIKHLYEKDELFVAFRKLIGKLRQAWNLSKTKSGHMPPGMRGKLRFANIFPCVNWAKKMLAKWDGLSEEVRDSLGFLKENKGFIQSLAEVEMIFRTVCTKLKNEGFGIVQKQEILDTLAKLEAGQKASVFIDNCKGYLERLTAQMAGLGQENLLCTSDIIESYFGKFKTKINSNSRSGLTEFIFTIATFGKSFSVQEAKQALETVQCKHLKLNVNKAGAA